MRHCSLVLIILLITTTVLLSEKRSLITSDILQNLPHDKVYTITEFKGNYAPEFTRELIQILRSEKNITFVDYDIHRMVLDENLRYAEPVFDDKYSEGIPSLISPDISIIGSANRQKSNIIFKQKEHLDYDITFIELATGIILDNINGRVQVRYNPPILLLIFVIALVLLIARWIIYLQRGYNVRAIVVCAMAVVTFIVVWYLL
jgi:hypothetical protein